jgi:hypothetical protein
MGKKTIDKPLTSEEIKLDFLRLEWQSKLKVLSEAKEKQELGQYLTLLTWLDETPTRFGGLLEFKVTEA